MLCSVLMLSEMFQLKVSDLNDIGLIPVYQVVSESKTKAVPLLRCRRHGRKDV
jgi:hypothetical protein